jgi:hypothetical protein
MLNSTRVGLCEFVNQCRRVYIIVNKYFNVNSLFNSLFMRLNSFSVLLQFYYPLRNVTPIFNIECVEK